MATFKVASGSESFTSVAPRSASAFSTRSVPFFTENTPLVAPSPSFRANTPRPVSCSRITSPSARVLPPTLTSLSTVKVLPAATSTFKPVATVSNFRVPMELFSVTFSLPRASLAALVLMWTLATSASAPNSKSITKDTQ